MKLYPELRKELFAADIDQRAVAEAIGRSVCYVNHRMVGVYNWSIEEAYALLRLIGKPPEDIFKFFPPGGGVKKSKRPDTAATVSSQVSSKGQ